MDSNTQSNNSYKNLAKNTAIFAVGSIGSKVLAFLIVPLYTYVLTPDEYGRIDLFTTAISLMVPFATLLIQEALLRFLMGKEITGQCAVNNCFLIFLGGAAATIALTPIFGIVFKFGEHLWLFVIILILNSFTQIFSQYFRAIGRNVAFTVNGIIVTVVLLGANLVFLVWMKCGISGYFYSMLLSQLASTLHILIAGRIFSELSFKALDFSALKNMLKFSIPLIPNTLMWWIMAAGDKYIINYFLGDGANGLYSLAMKVPTVICMLYTIFYQAWQMSAIEAKDRADEKRFYSNIFMITNGLLSVLIVGVIFTVKPLYLLAMSDSFAPSWKYVPLLSVATFFNCWSSFLGVVYTVSKKSHMAFYTTAVGAIVNLVFNLILVKRFGLYGIAVGTAIGYIAVTIMRVKDARREIGMTFDIARTISIVIIILIQAVCTTLFQGKETYIFGLCAFVVVAMLYRSEIKSILEMVKKKLRKA